MSLNSRYFALGTKSRCGLRLHNAVRVAEKLRQHNPRSRLEIWPRMPPVWQLFIPVLAEARRAIAQIGDFIRTVDG